MMVGIRLGSWIRPRTWRDLCKHQRQLAILIELAEHAVAGRRIGQVHKFPIAYVDSVPTMLSNDAWIVLMGSKIFLLHGGVKNCGEKIGSAGVGGGNPRVLSDT